MVALAWMMTGQAFAEPLAARLAAVPGDGRRFVLDTTPPNGWIVRQIVEVIELKFPGYLAEITLPTAIRPPLSGLSSRIEEGATVLQFAVACACSLSVAMRNGGLAIDLVDTDAGDGPPAPVHAPLPVARRRAGDKAAPEGNDEAIDVEEARRRMIEQLKRAAEAGLIEFDAETMPGGEKGPEIAGMDGEKPGDRPPLPPSEDQSDPEPRQKPGKASLAELTEASSARGRRGASEPMEPPAAWTEEDQIVDRANAASRQPAICHEPAIFDLPRARSAGDLVEKISRLRTNLMGEFDRPDPERALDLGRAYLSAGLADEALVVFTEFGDDDPRAMVLAEVATVIAGRTPPDGASVLRADCLGPQALWRSLALEQAGDDDRAMAAEQAAGRALESLPPALRKDVAARLGLAAADAGEWDAARRLHALAARTGGDAPDIAGWQHFLAARIALWNDDEPGAIRSLTLARAGDPAVEAAATLMLAETVLRSGGADRAGLARLIVDLGLLARLNRGTDVGARAAAMEVRLTDVHVGRNKAIDLLTLGLSLGDFTEETFTKTLFAMADHDDGSAGRSIAAIYLDDPGAFRPALSDAGFRAVLARSLVDLGLPAQAANLFAPGPLPTGIAAEIARGYLKVGDDRSAIALIADLPESPERDGLRRAVAESAGAVPTSKEATHGEPEEANVTVSPQRLAELAHAAIAAGDLQRALDLTLQRLKGGGDARAAETAALLAMALGKTEIPAEAADALKLADPSRLAAMTAAVAAAPVGVDPADPKATAAFLEQLDAEIAVIEDALDDG